MAPHAMRDDRRSPRSGEGFRRKAPTRLQGTVALGRLLRDAVAGVVSPLYSLRHETRTDAQTIPVPAIMAVLHRRNHGHGSTGWRAGSMVEIQRGHGRGL